MNVLHVVGSMCSQDDTIEKSVHNIISSNITLNEFFTFIYIANSKVPQKIWQP